MDARVRVTAEEETEPTVSPPWSLLPVLSFWNFTLGHRFGPEILRKPKLCPSRRVRARTP